MSSEAKNEESTKNESEVPRKSWNWDDVMEWEREAKEKLAKEEEERLAKEEEERQTKIAAANDFRSALGENNIEDDIEMKQEVVYDPYE
jgi:hypothetical protein